jgi:hypothetical protein
MARIPPGHLAKPTRVRAVEKDARMTFSFEPALQLVGTPTVVVRSLDDATDVLREYTGHRPATRDSILRRLTAASSEQEAGEAAKSFRWWAEQEGLLLQPK